MFSKPQRSLPKVEINVQINLVQPLSILLSHKLIAVQVIVMPGCTVVAL